MKLESFIEEFKAKLRLWYVLALSITSVIVSAQTSSCPLACNNLVQVSLDDDCRVEITPDMMLEGQGTNPSCAYSVTVMGANGLPIPGSPFVNKDQIDKTLTVKVSLASDGNSCWGKIKVEDKLGPIITCPPNLTITCYDNQTFPLPTARDNCDGPATVLLISNDLDDGGCNSQYTAVRRITYQAVDKSGNKSPLCVRIINYEKADIDDLEFPRNLDDVEDPSLNCSGFLSPGVRWDKDRDGYPDPDESGAPTIGGFPVHPNVLLCELNTTFTDQRINICKNSFKVLRKWTVLDWCSGQVREKFQIIKVVDKDGPVVTCPADRVSPLGGSVADVLMSDPYTCSASWNVPPPIVVFDCDDKTTYTVDYLLADSNGNPPVNGVYINTNVVTNSNGTYTIRNLPVGRTWIRYKVTDACGNFTYCFTEVDVIDNVPPTAVCDEFTVTTLTTGGVSQIFATTFDDGSHDNCTAVMLDARRTTPGCGASTSAWTNAVQFCCEDVGKDIMVSLRVTDKNGNTNTCMVIVRVQDKIDPKITCPPNITINCDQDPKNLDLTGRAVGTDNCAASPPTFVDAGSLNQCGVGVITRTWTTRDNNNPPRTASCTQRIEVRNNSPFRASDINWGPVSGVKVLNGCIDIDTDPSRTGRPTWRSDECDLVAATYQDQTFTVVDSACFKILRTWTIIDWCTFNQNNPNAGGIYQFTQVIKLNNTVKPVFDACADLTINGFGDKCEGFAELRRSATDDCTPSNLLVWTWAIDAFSDGTIDRRGNNQDASGNYPVGSHKITWTVEDKCGNKAICTQNFTIRDSKKPTPYCLSEITTVIMPNSGNIAIWARDFDRGSFDNCPGTLRFSFSPNVLDTGRVFTCNNLGLNDLRMYVTDRAGNNEYCQVKINIQANPGACGTTGNLNVIKTKIATDSDKPMSNIDVLLDGSEKRIGKTNNDGIAEFQNIPTNEKYELSAIKDNDYLNGVNTLDLVLIQRHILGTGKFNSPYKIIAADVNADSKITAADLVELRKLILGTIVKLSNNKSWIFADASQTFPDPSKPFPFVDKIKIDYTTGIVSHNLKGVKIGDVNESAAANANESVAQPRNKATLEMEINQQSFEKGNRINVPVFAKNANTLSGLQMTLNIDSKLRLIGVVPGTLNIKDSDIRIADEKLGIAYAAEQTVKINSNDELFALVFEAENDGGLNGAIITTNDIVKSEAYNKDYEVMNVQLSTRGGKVTSGAELMQNEPNPFNTTTTIKFVLPEAQTATLKIFDITGKTVYSKKGDYTKGVNQIVLNSDQLGAGGVLYYQLESNGFVSTKKMIMMNK